MLTCTWEIFWVEESLETVWLKHQSGRELWLESSLQHLFRVHTQHSEHCVSYSAVRTALNKPSSLLWLFVLLFNQRLISFFLLFNQAVQRQKGGERCHLTFLLSVTSWQMEDTYIYIYICIFTALLQVLTFFFSILVGCFRRLTACSTSAATTSPSRR